MFIYFFLIFSIFGFFPGGRQIPNRCTYGHRETAGNVALSPKTLRSPVLPRRFAHPSISGHRPPPLRSPGSATFPFRRGGSEKPPLFFSSFSFIRRSGAGAVPKPRNQKPSGHWGFSLDFFPPPRLICAFPSFFLLLLFLGGVWGSPLFLLPEKRTCTPSALFWASREPGSGRWENRNCVCPAVRFLL